MEAVASRRLWPSQEVTMIRDVMVWLDGGISDEVRLAAVADITRRLQSNVVIGLFLNPLPLPGPVSGEATAELVDGPRKGWRRNRAVTGQATPAAREAGRASAVRCAGRR